MSWFARSIANTFNLDDDDTEEQRSLNKNNIKADQKTEPEADSPSSPGKGVKDDLSEITKTLTTKLWGVASFLAPPPSDEHSNRQSDPDPVSGIRRDFAEIGGRFRSGISKLSTNIDVSEITKLASNILQLSPDGAEAIGVTDEVLAFVRDVTMHPETWMDFPISEVEEDGEVSDFELSDAQQEHALAVESLVSRLAALRLELCPGYMSESSFWKIYFVLLHPRLESHAAELLSTPEIVKARASLTHELKARVNTRTHEKDSSVSSGIESETVPLEVFTTQLTTSDVSVEAEKNEKHPLLTEEIQIVEKSVIQKEPRIETISNVVEDKDEDDWLKETEEIQIVEKSVIQKEPRIETISNVVEDKDEDDWLKEDSSENVNITGTTTVPVENDDDVSFSDLEEDDDGDDPTSYSKTASRPDLSTKDSLTQVSAHNSETKESDGWLDVDDINVV